MPKNKPKNREHKWMFSTVFCGTPSIQAYFYFEPQAQFPKVLYFRTNIFQAFLDTVPFSLDRTYKRRRAQEIVDAELRSAKVES